MRVIDPIETTDTNLLSSTIQEPDLTSGEQEYVSIPFDGYDISADGGTPQKVIKRKSDNKYLVWDSSLNRIRLYDEYFNLISNRAISSSASAGFNGFNSPDVVSISLSSGWPVTLHSADSDSLLENVESTFNAAGISTINPVGVFFASDGNFNNSLYVLNRISSTEYEVIKVKLIINSVVLYRNAIDSSTFGTPRDITYRNGEYKILFSDSSSTRVVIYDETFTSVVSVNTITGSNPDQPYDSLTITGGVGLKFLQATTMKIYNVDSSYNHGSSYKVGDQVIKAAIHKKYQCLIDTTQDPEVGVDEVPPTWLELGATNRWAMFDGANTYQSIYGSDVEIEIRPIGVISSICAFNIENVDSVEITTSVPDTGSSYTETFDTTGKDSLVTYDLPPYENPFVTIKFFGTDIKVGEVVMGQGTELGVLLAGAVSDRIDYSRYTYDEFGELTYVPRPIVNYTTYPIRVAKIDALGVERYLDNLKGKQAVWIGNIGDGQHLVTRGTIERSPMTYDTPSVLEYLIKVRGSI